jgi:hypothetical protein
MQYTPDLPADVMPPILCQLLTDDGRNDRTAMRRLTIVMSLGRVLYP